MVEDRPAHIAGVILAGGLSRRMNGDEKALIYLDGKTMLSHVHSRLEAQVSRLVINANGDPSRFKQFATDVVPDPIDGNVGPLAGVLAGLKWASQFPEISHVVTAAADTPFLPVNLVAKLTSSIADPTNEIAMASTDGRIHPVFGLWPKHLASSLESFLQESENRRVVAFAKKYKLIEVSFDEQINPVDPFFNVNTREDLSNAHHIWTKLNQ